MINLSSIVVWDFLPPLVITSLLEQAPDWLTRREYPPKFRFFILRESRVKYSICAASFARIAPQDCLSRLCIDLTCKSFARNASFTSVVNAPSGCLTRDVMMMYVSLHVNAFILYLNVYLKTVTNAVHIYHVFYQR